MGFGKMRENLLLTSFSQRLRETVSLDLLPTTLRLREVLRSGQIVFPRTSVISVIVETGQAQSVETALVGYEGAIDFGIPGTPLKLLVQAEGPAFTMSGTAFERHLDDPEFRAAMDANRRRLLEFMCVSGACQAFHTAEQRMARWLLEMADRVDDQELPLTQESLAAMIGVHRPTVTLAARILQASGMISYRYGRVTIVNRDLLEQTACECYAAVARRYSGGAV